MNIKTANKLDTIIVVGWFVVCALIVIILIAVSIKGYNTGKSPEQYKLICIEGHVYHTVNFGNKMGITIKLDDEGRPVKCQ